jgi:hypothetical protein
MTLFTKANKYDIYIYAPPYKRASAGVTVLYLLCDYLNRAGIQSWIVPDEKYFGVFGYSWFAGFGNLVTPIANIHSLKKGIYEARVPVVIYPETIHGNPLEFKNIVRYLLYYNSALEKVDSLESLTNEGVLYYSNEIGAHSLKNRAKPLFASRLTVPVQDPSVYKREPIESRSGIYYYAEKYINVHGLAVPSDVASIAHRITRDDHDSPSPEVLARLLSKAELLHVFEDTALIYEALLAGCVVNIHPAGVYGSKTGVATSYELGTFGTMMLENVTSFHIEKAQREIEIHIESYNEWIKKSEVDISNLIHHLSSFTSTYNKSIIQKLKARIASIDQYAKNMEVSSGNVRIQSIYKTILYNLKKLVPRRYRQKIIVIAKQLGRKVPTKYKPFLIKILTSLSK